MAAEWVANLSGMVHRAVQAAKATACSKVNLQNASISLGVNELELQKLRFSVMEVFLGVWGHHCHSSPLCHAYQLLNHMQVEMKRY